jgi:hypothetical protein
VNQEAALVFSTGYQTNLGVISSLVGRDDHLFSDKLNHASIVDGARLAFGTVHRFPHGDLRALERELARTPSEAGKLIVTDGIFSMEGTIVDLPGIMALAEFYGAEVLVDDAHSFGVLGEFGGGTAQHFHLEDRVSLIMATFSKSLASIGGVVAGPEDVIHYLKHHARSLIFSASNPPASVAASLAALDIIEQEPERREQLWRNTRACRRDCAASATTSAKRDAHHPRAGRRARADVRVLEAAVRRGRVHEPGDAAGRAGELVPAAHLAHGDAHRRADRLRARRVRHDRQAHGRDMSGGVSVSARRGARGPRAVPASAVADLRRGPALGAAAAVGRAQRAGPGEAPVPPHAEVRVPGAARHCPSAASPPS